MVLLVLVDVALTTVWYAAKWTTWGVWKTGQYVYRRVVHAHETRDGDEALQCVGHKAVEMIEMAPRRDGSDFSVASDTTTTTTSSSGPSEQHQRRRSW